MILIKPFFDVMDKYIEFPKWVYFVQLTKNLDLTYKFKDSGFKEVTDSRVLDNKTADRMIEDFREFATIPDYLQEFKFILDVDAAVPEITCSYYPLVVHPMLRKGGMKDADRERINT